MSTIGRDTRYARVIASAEIDLGSDEKAVAERLELHEFGTEEVRFSWWKNGKFMTRPLDIAEEDWIKLLSESYKNGVLSSEFMKDLEKQIFSI